MSAPRASRPVTPEELGRLLREVSETRSAVDRIEKRLDTMSETLVRLATADREQMRSHHELETQVHGLSRKGAVQISGGVAATVALVAQILAHVLGVNVSGR